jgi:hypothetical protein
MTTDLLADPFGEQSQMLARKRLHVLGGRFLFESNSRELLRLVDLAYAGLPRHRLSASTPDLTVRLWLRPVKPRHRRARTEPPPLQMLSGAGYLAGDTDSSNFIVMSPAERTALLAFSRPLLRFPYHTRYEFIEFAVFTLAARSQGLVPLHAACVGRRGRGILLMGESGAGKSTVTLQCLLRGLEILAEDSVFIAPQKLLATGVANFLHVRSDSLRWLERPEDAAAIRESPVIRRRSGVRKFEVDLRQGDFRLAPGPFKIVAIVFLTAQSAGRRRLLEPLSKTNLSARLAAAQAYALHQPEWGTFERRLSGVAAYQLRRGRHPLEAADTLATLLGSTSPTTKLKLCRR